ncbi:MAG: hypothetical protein HN623_10380 [Bdellovibrionales bacterium]|nr:hypothetical protein [Bdellovibrionales bacterium]
MTLLKFKIKEQFADLRAKLDAQKNDIPPQTQLLINMIVQLCKITL